MERTGNQCSAAALFSAGGGGGGSDISLHVRVSGRTMTFKRASDGRHGSDDEFMCGSLDVKVTICISM